MINNDNRNYNCVRERIQACFANLSKIILRAAKLQVYNTLIRPVATSRAETWTLTVTEENVSEKNNMQNIWTSVM
jgi:hypothetical protein